MTYSISKVPELRFRKLNILVLMATFNGSEWLEKQIFSIINQKNVNLDLLIADDSSRDDTLDIIRTFTKLNKHIRCIKRLKSFGTAGKNFVNLFTLVSANKYDYIALADQDDIWMLNKISKAIKSIEIENYSGYSSSVLAFWPNKKKKLIVQSKQEKIADFIFEGAGQGCTYLLPIRTFKKIQKFCIKHQNYIKDFYYHDWLIYLLVRSWGSKWFFDQTPSMYYRQHQSNDTGSRGTFSSVIKRFEKIRNGWYKKQILIALRIYFLAANQKNNVISNFSKIFNKKDSIKRRLLMAKFVWLHGRRRFSDRCILVFASFLGYI